MHILKEAKAKAGREDAGYWWHFRLAMAEFFFLLGVTIGSLIHAIFPWVLDDAWTIFLRLSLIFSYLACVLEKSFE